MSSHSHRRLRLSTLFGDLRVRPKLIVLHNSFFLVLTAAVYFTLLPQVEESVEEARRHETALVTELFRSGAELPDGETRQHFDYRVGSAEEAGVPFEARAWLRENPGRVWPSDAAGALFRLRPGDGRFERLRFDRKFHEGLVSEARWALFGVLGVIYVLAVALLELVIMPKYVYRPIRLTLEADEAVQRGDRGAELIDEDQIPGDEIGDIMRSRNDTIVQLRRHEEELETALARLEELAADLRRNNEMLEAAKENMAAQDRLASLGLLSASVAHEINTPLTVLHGSIEKMLEAPADEATERRLRRMLRVAERLRQISMGLLDFSVLRSDKDEHRPVSVRALADEAWQLVALDGKAAGAEFFNQAGEEHFAVGNEGRLMQVFVNLLRNAVYAISPGGHIRVESERVRDARGEWVEVAVEDDGEGIPEEVLPNIFEAFVTTRLDSKGTGLGLNVAAGIVRSHGGAISARNRPQGGARLEIRLPAAGVRAAHTGAPADRHGRI